jgi:hypothetical protein
MQNVWNSKSNKDVDDNREAAKMRMKLLRRGIIEANKEG